MIETSDILARLSSDSDTERREVLRVVSKLFLVRTGEHSERELALFSEILLALMCGLGTQEMAGVSNMLAPCIDTPRGVATLLGVDEDIRVSGPMLELSPVLSDADLVDIASEAEQDQLAAIGRRESLSSRVTDVLVTRGDGVVLTTVARNPRAELSDGGLETLVGRGSGWVDVIEALVRRPDLRAERLERAVNSLPPPVRSNFAALIPQGAENAARLLEAAFDCAASRRRREIEEIGSLVDLVRDGTRTLDGCVDDLCRARRLDDLAAFIARLSDLKTGEVMAALKQPNDFAIGILCRSIGVSERTYEAVASARSNDWAPGAIAPAESVANYRCIDLATAERALRFHKVRVRMS